MSSSKFVRPRALADGVIAKLRHPKTNVPLAPEGEVVDFSNIDARIFWMRRENEGDVEIFDSLAAAQAADARASKPAAKTTSSKAGDAQ